MASAIVRLAVLRLPPARRPGGDIGSRDTGGGRAAGHRSRPPDAAGERGSVSVEAALVMCALVAVLAMLLGGAAVVVAQVRCVDAAREAARLVARGEPARAEQAARRLAPEGADIAIRVAADEVIVRVSAEPAGGRLVPVHVAAEAVAVLEPGVAGAP